MRAAGKRDKWKTAPLIAHPGEPRRPDFVDGARRSAPGDDLGDLAHRLERLVLDGRRRESSDVGGRDDVGALREKERGHLVGGAAHVEVFEGMTGALLKSFFGPTFLFLDDGGAGGARVSAANVNNEGLAEILVAYGSGSARDVFAIDFMTLQTVEQISVFGPDFQGGLFVGANG